MFKINSSHKIALVCTGTPCENRQLVLDVRSFLEAAFGLEVVFGPDTYQEIPPKERAAIFLSYAFDDTVDVIWALRGGEGSADVLPYVAKQAHELMSARPKWILGFSDFTPFLVFFYEQLQWYSVHSIAAQQLMKTTSGDPIADISFDALRQLLIHNELTPLTQVTALNALAEAPIKQLVTGGNLSLLATSVGDIWGYAPKRKIVLIEEVNEPPYRFRRTVKYLERIGFFDNAQAILFAGVLYLPQQSKNYETFNQGLLKFLHEFSQTQKIPIYYTPEVSHGPINLPVPYFIPIKLSAGHISTNSVLTPQAD